jgi:hypothetical protein
VSHDGDAERHKHDGASNPCALREQEQQRADGLNHPQQDKMQVAAERCTVLQRSESCPDPSDKYNEPHAEREQIERPRTRSTATTTSLSKRHSLRMFSVRAHDCCGATR